MRLARSSLCAALLEQGEENLAVLIARASLPETLDSVRDAPALAALGLGEDDLRTMLPAIIGEPVARRARPESDEMAQTISGRWARLVSIWVRVSH